MEWNANSENVSIIGRVGYAARMRGESTWLGAYLVTYSVVRKVLYAARMRGESTWLGVYLITYSVIRYAARMRVEST